MWSYSLCISSWSLWWHFTFRFKMWAIWFWNKTYSRKALVKWISGSVEESDFAQSCCPSVLTVVGLGLCTLVRYWHLLITETKVSDKKWDRSSQWLLMEKNPKAHTMPFCSLPRDVACVWHALIRGFLNWHQAVPFWIGDVTVVEKPELWRGLRCQDHLFNFSPVFHWTKGI